jgi:hypothetical protein
MIIEIDGVLISDEIIKNKFVCNLNSCKGACCWEGDFGAPITKEEEKDIISNIEQIQTYLNDESIKVIEKNGPFEYYEEAKQRGTRLHSDGSCVFLFKDADGIAKCGIEQAFEKQKSTTNKPISCHMYPIRVVNDPHTHFESWYYDKWDICSAACTFGNNLNVPIYKFLKNAIIRYKGEEFYKRLDGVARHIS